MPLDTPEGPNEATTKDELIQRHKQEKKELTNKTQQLKKSVPKGDKKKKKEIADEIEKLVEELETRHKEELSKFENNEAEEEMVCDEANESVEKPENTRVSRAQKRRNKKANEEKERDKRILEQAEKNKEGPRVTEMNAIKEVLKNMNLSLYNIPADGNCLYCAIIHQLEETGRKKYSVNELRKITSDFMLKNKDDFMPFMVNELDESEIVSEDQFISYCKDVANTKLWGGQLELKALSSILLCPIKVIQANGPPTVQGENFKGPELTITYHRHLYRLGEHYNSTTTTNEDGDDE